MSWIQFTKVEEVYRGSLDHYLREGWYLLEVYKRFVSRTPPDPQLPPYETIPIFIMGKPAPENPHQPPEG